MTAGLPADWRARLRHRLLAAPDHEPVRMRLGGKLLAVQPDTMRTALIAAAQPATVLIPIVDRPAAPMLLLTTRAGHLRKHAGQISFPGGRIEPSDHTVLAAALREAREEVGIDDRYIEPLGFLPDHLVPTGFRITPVVGLIDPGFALLVDAAEVAEVFEMPLEFPCQPENFQPTRRVLNGVEVTLNDLKFGNRIIWGATALMLELLCATLRGES